MRPFDERLKLTNEQRKEVQRYLNSITVSGEEVILKIIRKMKKLEQKLEEKRYI